MKKLALIIFALCTYSVIAQTDYTLERKQKKQVLKSIKELSKKDCLIAGFEPNSSEEEIRQFETIQSFFLLDEKDLIKMLRSKNPYIRVYALHAFSVKYPELASNLNLAIYSDTSTAWFCTPEGRIDMGISIAKIASEIKQSIELSPQIQQKELQVNETIQNFISTYAKFPESYAPVSYSDFSMGQHSHAETGLIADTETYTIIHSYRIKNSKGEETDLSQYFKLNHKFEIVIIEDEKSNIFDQMPRLKVLKWIENFGRTLTSDEIEHLKIKVN